MSSGDFELGDSEYDHVQYRGMVCDRHWYPEQPDMTKHRVRDTKQHCYYAHGVLPISRWHCRIPFAQRALFTSRPRLFKVMADSVHSNPAYGAAIGLVTPITTEKYKDLDTMKPDFGIKTVKQLDGGTTDGHNENSMGLCGEFTQICPKSQPTDCTHAKSRAQNAQYFVDPENNMKPAGSGCHGWPVGTPAPIDWSNIPQPGISWANVNNLCFNFMFGDHGHTGVRFNPCMGNTGKPIEECITELETLPYVVTDEMPYANATNGLMKNGRYENTFNLNAGTQRILLQSIDDRVQPYHCDDGYNNPECIKDCDGDGCYIPDSDGKSTIYAFNKIVPGAAKSVQMQYSYYPSAYAGDPCTPQTQCVNGFYASPVELKCLPAPGSERSKYEVSTCQDPLKFYANTNPWKTPPPPGDKCVIPQSFPPGLKSLNPRITNPAQFECNLKHYFRVSNHETYINARYQSIGDRQFNYGTGSITQIQLEADENGDWRYPNGGPIWTRDSLSDCPFVKTDCMAEECGSTGIQILQHAGFFEVDFPVCGQPYQLEHYNICLACEFPCDGVTIGFILAMVLVSAILCCFQFLLLHFFFVVYAEFMYDVVLDWEYTAWTQWATATVAYFHRNPERKSDGNESNTTTDTETESTEQQQSDESGYVYGSDQNSAYAGFDRLAHNYNIGDRAEVKLSHGRMQWGTIEYIGTLQHLKQSGRDDRIYFGIFLDEEYGNKNGKIGEIEYFDCDKGYGVFVTESDIKTWQKQALKVYIGDEVEVMDHGYGRVQWIGNLPQNKKNLMFGVALKQRKGNHDGVHGGKRYFEANAGCGIFCELMDIISVRPRKIPFKNGDYVKLSNRTHRGKKALIKFIGEIDNKPGYIKYGVEVQGSRKGNNSGSKHGKKYFHCKQKKGLFVDEDEINGVLKNARLDYRVGDRVHLDGFGAGKIRWIGSMVEMPNDVAYGVELDKKVGKNDGKLNGRRYFSAGRERGVFVNEQYILIGRDD